MMVTLETSTTAPGTVKQTVHVPRRLLKTLSGHGQAAGFGRGEQASMAHPAIVISNGKVRTAGEVTGGMWSFLSFTRQTIAVMTSSMAACSFAWRRSRTA